MDHSNQISSEWIEKLILELDNVPVWADNYTICQNAAYALKILTEENQNER